MVDTEEMVSPTSSAGVPSADAGAVAPTAELAHWSDLGQDELASLIRNVSRPTGITVWAMVGPTMAAAAYSFGAARGHWPSSAWVLIAGAAFTVAGGVVWARATASNMKRECASFGMSPAATREFERAFSRAAGRRIVAMQTKGGEERARMTAAAMLRDAQQR